MLMIGMVLLQPYTPVLSLVTRFDAEGSAAREGVRQPISLASGLVIITNDYNRKEGGDTMTVPLTRDSLVVHGVPVVAGTRIPVWVIREYADDGMSLADIAEAVDYALSSSQIQEILRAVQHLSLEELGAPPTA